jgi:cytochrome c oxidase subunit 2
MSLTPPSKKWHIIPLGKDERVWIYLMILMVLMMGTLTVGWVFIGKQNPPEVYTKYDSVDDLQDDFIAKNALAGLTPTTLSNTEAAFAVPAGGDVYMYGERWNWVINDGTTTVSGLQFEAGERYRLHIGSIDVLHGFQLIGADFIISLQIVPEYDYVLDFTPDETGLFTIICNEYCGLGHQEMAGFLEVV